jgi:hypothetical protein
LQAQINTSTHVIQIYLPSLVKEPLGKENGHFQVAIKPLNILRYKDWLCGRLRRYQVIAQ